MTNERIIMGLLIGAVAYGCFIVMAPFFSAILWAAILTFTTWPIYARLRKGFGPVLASFIMTLLCAVAILLPLALVASEGVADGPEAARSLTNLLSPRLHLPPLPGWLAHLPMIGDDLSNNWELWARDLGNIGAVLRPYAGDIAQSVIMLMMRLANGGLLLVMSLFVAFFFWLSGESLGKTLGAVIGRLAGRQAGHLLRVIGSTVRGTVYGVLGTAIVQGILTGLGFAVTGLPDPILFGAIAGLLSVLPVGAPLVWVPAALWLAMTHHPWRGLILGIYGIVAISGADHIIRPIFISRGAQLPYLLTVIGVIGGVIAFGGLGIFLGPVLLAIGYTLTVEFAAGHSAAGPHAK